MRLNTRFNSTRRHQPSGDSSVDTVDQRANARLSVSCARSSASVVDPVSAYANRANGGRADE